MNSVTIVDLYYLIGVFGPVPCCVASAFVVIAENCNRYVNDADYLCRGIIRSE